MDSKHVKGLSVISISDGAKVGTIQRVYLDPAGRRIVGFVVGTGGLFGNTEGIVDAADVNSIGPDALTVDQPSAVRQDVALGQEGQLIDLDDLSKLKVVTEGGTYVGQVDSCEFDPTTFRLTAIVVSPGFFKSNKTVPINEVVSIGTDVVVVANRVCEPESVEAAVPGEAAAPADGTTRA